MPFLVLFLGILIVAAALRGKHAELSQLLIADLKGFVYWIAAILILAAIGAYKPLAPLATALMGLVVLSLMLAQGRGFFDKLQSQLAEIKA